MTQKTIKVNNLSQHNNNKGIMKNIGKTEHNEKRTYLGTGI